MPFFIGTTTHYDDVDSILDPLIANAAMDVQKGFFEGRVWDMLGAPEVGITDVKFEIFDRSRQGLAGTVGSGGWTIGGLTSLPVTADEFLQVGDILEVQNGEQVVVKSVNRSANTIDVYARGHGGTTAATAASGDTLTVIGQSVIDTEAKNVDAKSELSGKYINYTQNVFELISQTFTDRNTARKAFDENTALVREALDRVARKCYMNCIRGRKAVGTSSAPSTTAGILQQIAEGGDARSALRFNASAGTWNATNGETYIKSAMELAWAAGGNPDAVIVHPDLRKVFGSSNNSFINLTRGEAATFGTDNVTSFQYNGRVVDFVLDKDMPKNRALLVKKAGLKKGWKVGDMLRGPVEEPQESSRVLKFSIQGSYGVIVEGVGIDHVDIYNFSL